MENVKGYRQPYMTVLYLEIENNCQIPVILEYRYSSGIRRVEILCTLLTRTYC